MNNPQLQILWGAYGLYLYSAERSYLNIWIFLYTYIKYQSNDSNLRKQRRSPNICKTIPVISCNPMLDYPLEYNHIYR